MKMKYLLANSFLAATLAAAVTIIGLIDSVMTGTMRDPSVPVYSF